MGYPCHGCIHDNQGEPVKCICEKCIKYKDAVIYVKSGKPIPPKKYKPINGSSRRYRLDELRRPSKPKNNEEIERTRKIIFKMRAEKRTFSEIGEKLGMSPESASQRYYRYLRIIGVKINPYDNKRRIPKKTLNKVIRLLNNGHRQAEVSRMTGVSPSTVSKMFHKHILRKG